MIFKERGYENFLKENNVNLEGIIKCENEPCFHTKIFVADRKDTITFVQMRHLQFGEPNETHYRLIDQAEILYFAINDLKFNLKCLNYASNKRKTIIHNLSSEIIFDTDYLPYAMENSDIQILNEAEYKNLCNLQRGDINDILERYSRLQHLIVTKGKLGSSLFSKEGKDIKKTDVDSVFVERGGVPVGLGDAYSAGVVYGISIGWDLQRAIKFGSYLGAVSFQSEYSFIERKILEECREKFDKEFK
jgi:sugar/nucleoside kinase (ribokinase family)